MPRRRIFLFLLLVPLVFVAMLGWQELSWQLSLRKFNWTMQLDGEVLSMLPDAENGQLFVVSRIDNGRPSGNPNRWMLRLSCFAPSGSLRWEQDGLARFGPSAALRLSRESEGFLLTGMKGSLAMFQSDGSIDWTAPTWNMEVEPLLSRSAARYARIHNKEVIGFSAEGLICWKFNALESLKIDPESIAASADGGFIISGIHQEKLATTDYADRMMIWLNSRGRDDRQIHYHRPGMVLPLEFENDTLVVIRHKLDEWPEYIPHYADICQSGGIRMKMQDSQSLSVIRDMQIDNKAVYLALRGRGIYRHSDSSSGFIGDLEGMSLALGPSTNTEICWLGEESVPDRFTEFWRTHSENAICVVRLLDAEGQSRSMIRLDETFDSDQLQVAELESRVFIVQNEGRNTCTIAAVDM